MKTYYKIEDTNFDKIDDAVVVFSDDYLIPLVGDSKGVVLSVIPFTNNYGKIEAEKLAKIYCDAINQNYKYSNRSEEILSYLEYENLDEFGKINYHFDLDISIREFNSQPFTQNLITQLFDGFERTDNYRGSIGVYIIDSELVPNNIHNDELIFYIGGGYSIAGYTFDIVPRILDEFIIDCKKVGIKLIRK